MSKNINIWAALKISFVFNTCLEYYGLQKSESQITCNFNAMSCYDVRNIFAIVKGFTFNCRFIIFCFGSVLFTNVELNLKQSNQYGFYLVHHIIWVFFPEHIRH